MNIQNYGQLIKALVDVTSGDVCIRSMGAAIEEVNNRNYSWPMLRNALGTGIEYQDNMNRRTIERNPANGPHLQGTFARNRRIRKALEAGEPIEWAGMTIPVE